MRALLHHSTQTQKDIIVCNNYRHHSSLQNFVVSCYNIWWACKNYIQYIYQRWLTVGQSAKYIIEIYITKIVGWFDVWQWWGPSHVAHKLLTKQNGYVTRGPDKLGWRNMSWENSPIKLLSIRWPNNYTQPCLLYQNEICILERMNRCFTNKIIHLVAEEICAPSDIE